MLLFFPMQVKGDDESFGPKKGPTMAFSIKNLMPEAER
jgi:hypothetical protein